MAWSWSHTIEAYQNARENVQSKPHSWLAIVFAEWKAHEACADEYPDDDDSFDQKAYEEALRETDSLSDDVLADLIWEKMEQLARCENGGYEAHCCPFSCGCHMVSFEKESNEVI